MRLIGMLIFTVLISCGASVAQGWRGIIPLHSTCEDVKRVLGVDKCEYPNSTYQLENETVTISFETCPCPISCSYQSRAWNVPAGTVSGIARQLRKPLPIASFAVDDKWKKLETDFIGELIYDNYEQGISLSAVNGEVVNVTYYAPLDKNKHLLCPKCSVPPPSNPREEVSLSVWLNGYGDIPFDDQRKRLDKFAEKLKEHRAELKGYIVVYGGCRARKVDSLAHARRAERYLISAHHIKSTQIMTIYGGQREEMLIELYVRDRRLPLPRTFSSTYPSVIRHRSSQ